MIHWEHAATPFGNIVFSTNRPEDAEGVTLSILGAGSLPADEALRENFEGDTVPDFDRLRDHAREVAEAEGHPFASFYSPLPALTINGVRYHDSFNVDAYDAELLRTPQRFAGRACVTGGSFTTAARRKLAEWFTENRADLVDARAGRVAVAGGKARVRRAREKWNEAEAAVTAASAEYSAAVAALWDLGYVLRSDDKVVPR